MQITPKAFPNQQIRALTYDKLCLNFPNDRLKQRIQEHEFVILVPGTKVQLGDSSNTYIVALETQAYSKRGMTQNPAKDTSYPSKGSLIN